MGRKPLKQHLKDKRSRQCVWTDAEDGKYHIVMWCLSEPGAITEAETLGEAIENMRDILNHWPVDLKEEVPLAHLIRVDL